MIKVLDRSEIFREFSFIDNQIAFAQQSIYRTINQDDPDEVKYMMPFLDHMHSFSLEPKQHDNFYDFGLSK